MNTRKKTLIGGGIALVLIAVGGTAAWAYSANNSPEKTLYSALSTKATAAGFFKETARADGTNLDAIGTIKTDGQVKMSGEMKCSTKSTESGDIDVNINISQVNEKTYMNFAKIAISNTGDTDTETAINDYLNQTLSGTWIELADPDPAYQGYKEKGVSFTLGGIESKSLTAEQIAQKIEEHKVYTVNSSKNVTVDGKAAIEYDLSVRRSAYEKLIDEVAPGFPYKTDLINTMFDNDKEELTLTVDKKDKTVISTVYGMANPCIDFMSIVDPTAAAELPEVVRSTTAKVTKNDADKIAAPAEFITESEFAAIMAPQEEVEE